MADRALAANITVNRNIIRRIDKDNMRASAFHYLIERALLNSATTQYPMLS
jgi:hypothetical protein